MDKMIIDKLAFCLPWTMTLLGTHTNGKANFMALDWLTRVNFQPAMIGACVGKSHVSHAAIQQNGEFSINVPSTDMVQVTDYCGIVSGSKEDKSKLFDIFYGQLKAAPLIRECPINIECKLVQSVDLPTNTFFIAEIVNIYTEEKFLSNGKPDAAKVRPFLLTMPDNWYWSVGGQAGNAWKDGVKYKESLEG